jgi:hypothetical protein
MVNCFSIITGCKIDFIKENNSLPAIVFHRAAFTIIEFIKIDFVALA